MIFFINDKLLLYHYIFSNQNCKYCALKFPVVAAGISNTTCIYWTCWSW